MNKELGAVSREGYDDSGPAREPPVRFRDPDFEAQLAAAPHDQGLRLVYADLVADHGDEEYERALRLMAGLRIGPAHYEDRVYLGRDDNPNCRDPHDYPDIGSHYRAVALPAAFFLRMAGPIERWSYNGIGPLPCKEDSWLYFASVQQATEYLARALEETRPPPTGDRR